MAKDEVKNEEVEFETPWKPHLKLKRFERSELTPGAKRTHDKTPHDAEVKKSTGRATCHVCRGKIDKGNMQVCLWLQCHKGYKNACYVHVECLCKHPESAKLTGIEEIKNVKLLDEEQKKRLKDELAVIVKEEGTKKKVKSEKKTTKKETNTSSSESPTSL
uniref:PARP-type domain-containing protein n=1 Tax=Paramoeba aestuarina TaxID=180227 RepID=A0A7S4UKU6_9EUKA|mmetsp:Transcript_38087/g.60259  ORF Transcript_38087/g.60259 Transcript_38087/m.60259 type:complete len:161 (+) Transcript_38087:154-636(+)|eukprot:CAMPEP_0201522210 /NCGR_PEP_ID=MMETSP0161_2-20130828/16507_1 /ASSEMBLY_ACC=CAM_ASM_000251 /TAXON_ID=180227 /ORGANISM="Neoparamoeba aestuarina, Strain SoJaBio B1-5/56/2" /LENGTH=160 /DNA_ID=CAMNT_0047920987 /DNA_START=166 /DNA_END=648 /DNA_ORIENTATION=-